MSKDFRGAKSASSLEEDEEDVGISLWTPLRTWPPDPVMTLPFVQTPGCTTGRVYGLPVTARSAPRMLSTQLSRRIVCNAALPRCELYNRLAFSHQSVCVARAIDLAQLIHTARPYFRTVLLHFFVTVSVTENANRKPGTSRSPETTRR